MIVSKDQKQLLHDNGFYERNVEKPGLFHKLEGKRDLYIDLRGSEPRAYAFNAIGQSEQTEKGNKLVRQLKVMQEGQTRLEV